MVCPYSIRQALGHTPLPCPLGSPRLHDSLPHMGGGELHHSVSNLRAKGFSSESYLKSRKIEELMLLSAHKLQILPSNSKQRMEAYFTSQTPPWELISNTPQPKFTYRFLDHIEPDRHKSEWQQQSRKEASGMGAGRGLRFPLSSILPHNSAWTPSPTTSLLSTSSPPGRGLDRGKRSLGESDNHLGNC